MSTFNPSEEQIYICAINLLKSLKDLMDDKGTGKAILAAHQFMTLYQAIKADWKS